MTLQAKYSLAITVLIVGVSAVVALMLQAQFHRTASGMTEASLTVLDHALTKEIEKNGEELATLFASHVGHHLAAGDGAMVGGVLEQLRQQKKELRFAVVADRSGQLYTAGTGAAAPDHRPSRIEVEHTGELLTITYPITDRAGWLATLRLGFSLEPVRIRNQEMAAELHAAEAANQRRTNYQLAGVFALLVLVGVALGTVTARRLSQPVRALARQANAFAAGELNRPQPPTQGHDELAELADAFEQMRSSLSRTTVSRDFLHRIIDSQHEGLVVTGPAGAIRLINRAAAEISGYPPEELLGRPFSGLVADPGLFATADRKVVESALLHHERGWIPVEISRSRLGAENGDESEQVYVISDITARKALEEELLVYRSRLELLVVERTKELTAAIQELESFSYSVSHDLHAPLRAISGFGAALLEDYYDLLGDTGRNYLERINSATVRMGELIDGLLTLSRVARREVHRGPVDLSAIASAQATELAAADPLRQVTFRIAPKLRVEADRALMRLLLQNLFGNAWKFTRDQRSALIELGQVEFEGSRVLFVRDNGAGFDTTSAQGLFQPFHRMHSNKEFPGTGIGLATVQRIIARHGGDIWAEAAPGAGATFYFTLPDQAAAQVEESRVSSRAPLSNSVSSQRPSPTA